MSHYVEGVKYLELDYVEYYKINLLQLSIVGVRGSGYKGDAAFDDVFLTSGLCSS